MIQKANSEKLKEVLYTDDLFITPYSDCSLVYAPLYNFSFICSIDVAEQITSGREKNETDFLNIDALAQEIAYMDINLDQLKIHKPYNSTDYQPNEVMLSLTSECNLCCSYCYIKGGDSNRKLKWEIAKAAIDYICNTAISLNKNEFALSFHGEGEPSCNWPLLKRCVLYSEKIAEDAGLDLKIYMSTNCILNKNQIEFVKTHFHSISASFDILEDIQNVQRPRKNGKGSFNSVYNTLKSFDQDNFHYGLRTTVTPLSVYRLEEAVDFVANNLSTKSIQFDPVCSYGRCYETGIKEIEPAVFIRQYRKARIAAMRGGITISYSGCRPENITPVFCGAEGGNFAVSTTGCVSTCFEVLSPDDPRAQYLIIGRYDKDKKQFIINKKRIKALLSRTPDTIEKCNECFAKWNCAGECVAKILQNTPNDMNAVQGSYRCTINRELLKDELVARILKDSIINSPK